jgi:hypothetical protein
MTTYTVYQSDDSSVAWRGLSLDAAADALLCGDGYAYEIREENGLFELLVSDGSVNSPRGARNLVSCAAGGFVATSREALLTKIAADEWHGYEAGTDEDYDAMIAASLEDEDVE